MAMFPQRGQDIRTETEISFRESYTGTTRAFTIGMEDPCPVCGGKRSKQRRCAHCQGTGLIRTSRKVRVNIPAGVDDNMQVRVAGEGNHGLFGGAPGDFFVQLTVTPDLHFGRDGTDLFVAAKVERSIALNGGTIEVTMPDGQTVNVRIPRGRVEDGTRVRVRNQGMPLPHQTQRGDLYVTVTIIADRPHAPVPAPMPRVIPRSPVPFPPPPLPRAIPHSPVPFPPLGSAQAAAPHQAGRLNTQIGNYRITRLLGTGGFAEVYLAEHVYLRTPAAIKILRDQVKSTDAEEFLREAQTVASLKHTHIVRIFDFGIEASTTTPYLVMDYAADGTVLDRHAEGLQLPFATIVSYVSQIAEALDYAHGQRVIHRDVKPANMLVEADHLLLSDFGIAVAAHTTRSIATQDAIGTVTYMAPEQIRKKPRPASDQYALAVVAYEWLVGEPPFTGDAIEVAMCHLSDTPPSLCLKRPDLSLAGEQAILRALAKDPDQRFSSVRAFAEALQQYL